METAEKDTRHLQTMQSAPEVHHNTSQKQGMGQNSQLQDKASVAPLSCCVADVERSRTHKVSIQGHCLSCVQDKGHIMKVCRSRVSQGRPTRRTHYVDEDQGPQGECVFLVCSQELSV